MNPHWRSFLESAEANFAADAADVLDFGDAAGELQAAGRQTVLVPLTHLALIAASGEDCKSFLHSQLTSDVNHLAPAQAQHAGWCTAKGRMQASFVVARSGDVYRLLVAADLAEATQKRLQMFVLRAKVKLSAETERVLLGVAGPQAAEALADAGLPLPAAPLAVADGDTASVLQLDAERYVVMAGLDAAPGLWQKLGVKARPAGVPVWRWLDVHHAFPLVTLATKEEFVPQMADFEKIGGVSFHKGCYPGQEIVARTQYLGKVKRHLYRLSGEVPLAAGDELYSPDNLEQAAGKVMTAAPSPAGGFVALAVVQSNYAGNLRLGTRDGAVVLASAVNPA
ncbi:CAF17-like 4Fe-4S cluster assembly/insertion protein YgfZ [Azonexus fungiphilus]|uniref:CAF17-like 4Fe-4S cluster assembly/insertion protein YgfZ n=1 Tax=Azonexus fungiphilus TaxID=146940 RepID=UPI00156AD338|nr:folate-binding protein YgfZ [Azonexus fungiphilus]NHC05830.1 folate-binding protein YgfZ [Azonexus fungiphilus]